MQRFYDKKKERLVFIGQGASADFWDEHWGKVFEQEVQGTTDTSLVVNITKRFLPPPAKILEGGCGRGQYVYSLGKNGYDVYGVDYASATVELINKNFSDLKVFFGDVRKLSFADEEFDGYWSLGVIEHFYNGYEDIIKEMARVVKPGGRLFLVFPAFSPFRRLRARLGLYPSFRSENFHQKSFYQFALGVGQVVADLKPLGFKPIFKKYTNGFKTVREETLIGAWANQSKVLKKIVKKIANSLSFFLGHTVLLVLERK